MTTRNEIAAEACSWVGVRWRHQGRSREHGIDCAGLVIMVAQRLGLSDFDITNYRREPRPDKFVGIFREHMDEKPLSERRKGDIVLTRDRQHTCHCTMLVWHSMLERECIVHAYAPYRKVVLQLYSAEWLAKSTRCFSYRGIED